MNKLIPFFFILCCTSIWAQEDCLLGIGGKNDATIAEVFNLNRQQMRNLRNWGAELRHRNEIFIIKAEYLLKNHPQSSEEDLLKMSYVYKGHLDSMMENARMIDKRMLRTFSDSQYNLYIKLCNSVLLTPLFIDREQQQNQK